MTLREVKDDIYAQEPGRQARGCAQVSGAYRLARDHDRLERENAELRAALETATRSIITEGAP